MSPLQASMLRALSYRPEKALDHLAVHGPKLLRRRFFLHGNVGKESGAEHTGQDAAGPGDLRVPGASFLAQPPPRRR